MIIYAAAAFLVTLSVVLHAIWYGRLFHPLAAVPLTNRPLPKLSIIVTACNEEATIRATAESLLGQDYPNLELILINDRSTDATGELIRAVAAEHPGAIHPIMVDKLPAGWLGKNHALWLGAARATGEWLLFTDADVLFDPTCLRRAVAYAEAEGLDHLALFPGMVAHSFPLQAFIAYFVRTFCTYNMTLMANEPRRALGTGCGGFNLVRRSAYAAAGTHRAISLRPDDDVRLGMRLKRSGARQRIMSGAGMAWVEWYPSLKAAIQGLEKNSFAVADYSLPKAVAMAGSLLALDSLPYLLVWFAHGPARWLLLATILTQFVAFVYTNSKATDLHPAHFLLSPLAALTFTWTFVRATWLTYQRGGIVWRGTLYPLTLLRSQTGLEGLAPWKR